MTFWTPTSGLVGSLDQGTARYVLVVRELGSSVLQTSPCSGDCAQIEFLCGDLGPLSTASNNFQEHSRAHKDQLCEGRLL